MDGVSFAILNLLCLLTFVSDDKSIQVVAGNVNANHKTTSWWRQLILTDDETATGVSADNNNKRSGGSACAIMHICVFLLLVVGRYSDLASACDVIMFSRAM